MRKPHSLPGRIQLRRNTAAHRTLHCGTVLTVQKGSRSLQVTVTDCGPFTGAFLDLSPDAASALGCRCTHRNVSATVMQMGSGATAAEGRGPQRSLAAVPMPLFQPRGTACIHWECSDPQWPWLLSAGPASPQCSGLGPTQTIRLW